MEFDLDELVEELESSEIDEDEDCFDDLLEEKL